MSDPDRIPGYIAEATLPDGRRVAIAPLTFGRWRIVAGRPEWWADGWDDGW